MKVEIWFQRSSQPIIYKNAKSTYQKGDLFCVEVGDERHKFPIDHLFKIKETDFISSQSDR